MIKEPRWFHSKRTSGGRVVCLDAAGVIGKRGAERGNGSLAVAIATGIATLLIGTRLSIASRLWGAGSVYGLRLISRTQKIPKDSKIINQSPTIQFPYF